MLQQGVQFIPDAVGERMLAFSAWDSDQVHLLKASPAAVRRDELDRDWGVQAERVDEKLFW